MELNTLQSRLWRAAPSIRGEVDAARGKDYILPLIFYKRIDDVFSDELARVGKALAVDAATAGALVDADRNLVRFYLPAEARWQPIRGLAAGLGERITDNLRAITREKPDLVGVIDRRDFNATEGNQCVLDDNALARLIDILSEQRLGLRDVQPDLPGRAYEYLIRKFAERGSSAGECFTPTGGSTCMPQWSRAGAWRWCSTPAQPAGAAATRGATPSGTSASSSWSTTPSSA